MAELIADFLLDLDIAGARVELLLPLEMCEWRVLDHVHGCIDVCDFDRIVLLSDLNNRSNPFLASFRSTVSVGLVLARYIFFCGAFFQTSSIQHY